jgi:hypothetical protein
MQNPEEDILQRFLQDTFSDYEPMPTEQSWEHIHKAIQPQRPSVGGRVKQWIVPIVGLLLLIGGVVWNTNQASDELEDKSIALLTTPETLEGSRPLKGRLPLRSEIDLDNHLKINELKDNTKKLLVDKTTSKEEGELPTVAKKQSEVFEKNTSDGIVPNIITREEIKNISPVGVHEVAQTYPSAKPETNVLLVSLNDKSPLAIDSKELSAKTFTTAKEMLASSVIVGVHTDNFRQTIVHQNDPVTKRIHTDFMTENNVENAPTHQSINDATIQEVRYVKPIETLKNKDFVISKPQFELAKINQISIAKETKPIRRPTYISLSIMPLQTYRILTVNRRDIQNLQTNNLFDSERNGFALELGIVKPIANSWNFRSSLSYLKMRQWAEYQVNTEVVSVKNPANNSNNVALGTNDNEFIGQTQIENKTLQMVGLKADVQKFFKLSGRNRYFISTGTQLMYETNEKQTNVFINASAGFQHVVNKDLFLTVEPTASYLLYNINDSKSLIQTNAYNLGLKIGVNFRVK